MHSVAVDVKQDMVFLSHNLFPFFTSSLRSKLHQTLFCTQVLSAEHRLMSMCNEMHKAADDDDLGSTFKQCHVHAKADMIPLLGI